MQTYHHAWRHVAIHVFVFVWNHPVPDRICIFPMIPNTSFLNKNIEAHRKEFANCKRFWLHEMMRVREFEQIRTGPGNQKQKEAIVNADPSIGPLFKGNWIAITAMAGQSLQWRQNENDGVSNHQLPDCLLNRLYRRRSKKTSKLRVTGLSTVRGIHRWPVNSPHKKTEKNVSIWWRHHVHILSVRASSRSVLMRQLTLIILGVFYNNWQILWIRPFLVECDPKMARPTPQQPQFSLLGSLLLILLKFALSMDT